MNKHLFPTLLLLIAVLSGCQREVIPSYHTVTLDTISQLLPQTENPNCHITMKLELVDEAVPAGKAINDTILSSLFGTAPGLCTSQAIKAFCRNTFTEFRQEVSMMMDDMEKEWIDQGVINYTFDFTGTASRGRNGLINYHGQIYQFTGGAHPSTSIILLNFDPQTGKVVTLDDILEPGYQMHLKDCLTKALCKEYNAKNIDELNEQAILLTTDIYIPDNYLITDDGINFLFNQYEIAPYAVGIIQLDIKNEDLKFKK